MNSNPQEEKRQAQRVPVQGEVKLEFESFQGFITEIAANLSLGGMFIQSQNPPPLGTVVKFRLRLKEGLSLIEGSAEVTWIRPSTEAGDRLAGMGVRFIKLTPESRDLVFKIVDRHIQEGGKPFDLTIPAPSPPDPLVTPFPEIPEAPRIASTQTPSTPWPPEAPQATSTEPSASAPQTPGAGRAHTEEPPAAPTVPSAAPPPPATATPAASDEPVPQKSPGAPTAPPPESEAPETPQATIAISREELERAFQPIHIPDSVEPDEPTPTPGPATPPAETVRPPVAPLLPPVAPLSPPETPVPPNRPAPPSSGPAGRSAQARSRRLPFSTGILVLLVSAGVLGGATYHFLEELADWMTGQQGAVVEPGPGLIIDIPPVEAYQELPVTEPLDPAEEAASSAVEPDEIPSAPAPTGAAAPPPESEQTLGEPSPRLSQIRLITWKASEGETVVTLFGDGVARPQDYTRVRLQTSPPRELLKIRGINWPFREPVLRIDTPEVQRLRTGFHATQPENELHIVLDLTSARVQLTGIELDEQKIHLHLTQ
jgi:uncharacterized protein (TIGR02266 family)